MRRLSIVVSVLMVGGLFALAQSCPSGSTCVVPARSSVSTCPGTCPQPVATCPGTCPQHGNSCPTSCPRRVSSCPPNPCPNPCDKASKDTKCILSALAALQNQMVIARAEVRGQALELRASALAERMDNLIAQETMFRQQITTNPNTPGAQIMAMNLLNQASALDRDLAAFNIALTSVPSDLRPYVGPQIGMIEMAYLAPAAQRFTVYQTQLTQRGANPYQVAFASNVWLEDWQNAYLDDLCQFVTTSQTIAQARWWGSPRVLGTSETLINGTTVVMPNGNTVMLPSGASIYMPAGASTTTVPGCSTCPAPNNTLPLGGVSY